MLQVFSEKKDLVCEEKTGNGQNDDSVTSGDSSPSEARDPLRFFDGTEFAKASAMMAQEFSNDLALSDEEFRLNLEEFGLLQTPDPVLGGPDFGNFCINPDNLFSQLSFDGTSKDDEDSDMIKKESGIFSVQEPNQFVEYEEEEEIEQPSSSSVSPIEKSPPQLQHLVPMQSQPQEKRVLPNIAFSNHGLLPPAPPINQSMTSPGTNWSSGQHSRLVKIHPQQQQIRTTSNFSASSYSPPPTNGSKSSGSRGAVYARQYRQKNREHVEQLEGENERLVRENEQLRGDYEQMRQDKEKLSREVTYLRQVLQNQSAIASILNTVTCNAPGLKLRFATAVGAQKQPDTTGRTIATRASSKRKNNDQDQQQSASKRSKGNEANQSNGAAGVCLHVNGDTVSVEFCSRCNRESRCVDDQWNRQ